MKGSNLLSHTVTSAVPSALRGLTSVFEMGTGVSLSLWPPSKPIRIFYLGLATTGTFTCKQEMQTIKPHDRLVPVSLTHYCAYTSGLSTSSSSRGLQGPYGHGISHLEGGFPLRCFQRLSRPNMATQRCPWRDNWYTRGSSIPVLSY